MKKPSFLERLTGSVPANDYDRILDEEHHFGDEETEENDNYQTDDNWQETDDHHTNQQEGEHPLLCDYRLADPRRFSTPPCYRARAYSF